MKTIRVVFLLVLPLTIFAGEVKRGDNIEAVRATLGTPRGQSRLGARELLYFDRGEVELSAGLVTRVALRSEKDQAAFEAKRTAEADRVRRQNQTLLTEGEALKNRMLADPAFQATPLSYQVAFWQNFSRKYSMVSCTEQLSIAQARLDEQVQATQKSEQAQRIADLEAKARERERENRARTYYPYYDDSRDFHPLITTSYGRRTQFFHQDNNDALACRPIAHRPTIPTLDEQLTSSHTAEAFAGKNWLVWPSPAHPSRTGPF